MWAGYKTVWSQLYYNNDYATCMLIGYAADTGSNA